MQYFDLCNFGLHSDSEIEINIQSYVVIKHKIYTAYSICYHIRLTLKILHIVAGELSGGAARGAYWLHLGLLESGVDSKVLTNGRNTLGDETVSSIIKNKKDQAINSLRAQVDNLITKPYRSRKKIIFSSGLSGFDFTKTEEYKSADIIHLHWINGGLVNISHLSKIKKPIVWTMRDMWPMTGGCHYSMECTNFKVGCGNCKQLGSIKELDISRIILNRKKRLLPDNLTLIGLSSWLSEQAAESSLFKNSDIRTIYNNINCSEFFPLDKTTSRETLGIHTDKKIILAGSTDSKDFYKGFDKYLEALQLLDPNKYHLCFFGNLDKTKIAKMQFDSTSLGYLHDNISLRLAYSSADVFVAPSLMDAFGKTLTEAMSCGTPVVCFDATGPKDIVTHKYDGYKATPFSSKSLADGIDWITNASNYQELCMNARNKVVNSFDYKIIATQYKALYEEILYS